MELTTAHPEKISKLLQRISGKALYGKSLTEDKEEFETQEGKQELTNLLIKISKSAISALTYLGVNLTVNNSLISFRSSNCSSEFPDLEPDESIDFSLISELNESLKNSKENKMNEILDKQNTACTSLICSTNVVENETFEKEEKQLLNEKLEEQRKLIKNLVEVLQKKEKKLAEFENSKKFEKIKDRNKMLHKLFLKCNSCDSVKKLQRFTDKYKNYKKFILPIFTSRPTALKWLLDEMKEVTLKFKIEEFEEDFLDLFVPKGTDFWKYNRLYKEAEHMKYEDENPQLRYIL